jgi:hypothetical protein
VKVLIFMYGSFFATMCFWFKRIHTALIRITEGLGTFCTYEQSFARVNSKMLMQIFFVANLSNHTAQYCTVQSGIFAHLSSDNSFLMNSCEEI